MPVTLLPFLLLLIPIMEIGVFIVVGGEIGVLWTIGLVFFTAVLGTILLRIEGFRTFEKIRAKMNSGEIPGRPGRCNRCDGEFSPSEIALSFSHC